MKSTELDCKIDRSSAKILLISIYLSNEDLNNTEMKILYLQKQKLGKISKSPIIWHGASRKIKTMHIHKLSGAAPDSLCIWIVLFLSDILSISMATKFDSPNLNNSGILALKSLLIV